MQIALQPLLNKNINQYSSGVLAHRQVYLHFLGERSALGHVCVVWIFFNNKYYLDIQKNV